MASLDKDFFSDKVWFQFSGYVSIQTGWTWNAENTPSFHKKSLHSLRVGVWCTDSF
jgi:hypothetical protein